MNPYEHVRYSISLMGKEADEGEGGAGSNCPDYNIVPN